MSVKICVLGAGTASSIALLDLYSHLNVLKKRKSLLIANSDLTIDCIYDPNTPTIQVGESSSIAVYKALFEVLDFCIIQDLPKINGTVKWGARYFWEPANDNNFIIRHFHNGLHFNSETFSFYVLNELVKKFSNFNVIKDNIINISQDKNKVTLKSQNNAYVYDFLIDCRGTPSTEELNSGTYNTVDFAAVNSVILNPEYKTYNETYTSAHIHKNGWMFGIPLQHRKTWGYLYNNNITTDKEAIEHFSELKNIDASVLRRLNWKQYYRKKAIDNRILYMGNRLHFFEPAMSMPLHFYCTYLTNILPIVMECLAGKRNFADVTLDFNERYSYNITQMLDLIALHYASPNKIQSEYWIQTRLKAVESLKASGSFVNYAKLCEKEGKILTYWTHGETIMSDYINGWKIDLKEFIVK